MISAFFATNIWVSSICYFALKGFFYTKKLTLEVVTNGKPYAIRTVQCLKSSPWLSRVYALARSNHSGASRTHCVCVCDKKDHGCVQMAIRFLFLPCIIGELSVIADCKSSPPPRINQQHPIRSHKHSR